MSNLVKALRDEIARLSRREAKALVGKPARSAAQSRRAAADLKRRVADLERSNRELRERLAKLEGAQPAPAPEKQGRGWISGKRIRSMRKKLGLSQREFAALAGVSDQMVWLWEKKPGMLDLRSKTKAALFAIRDMGAREAKKRLAELAPKKR